MLTLCLSLASLVTLAPIEARARRSSVTDFNRQLGMIVPDFQASVQQKVNTIMGAEEVVGATVCVVVDGKLKAAVAYGKRKSDSLDPMVLTDPMHIGSNTKGMTALIFGRLTERGRIRFDETIREAFPYPASASFANLPLIELMYQRSGINDKSSPPLFGDKYLPKPPDDYFHAPLRVYQAERQLYVKDTIAREPGYAPGSKYVYCNTNFILTGAAEEIATGGKHWEDLIQSEVFQPLHMRTAGFGPMGSGQDVQTPWQHEKKDGKWIPIYFDNPSFLGPAGTVHCSVLDLANYVNAQAQGSLGDQSYLSTKTWKTLQTPPDGFPYACGMLAGKADSNGVRNLSHEGSNNLSMSEWWVAGHGRIALVVMMNCVSAPALRKTLVELKKLSEQTFDIPD